VLQLYNVYTYTRIHVYTNACHAQSARFCVLAALSLMLTQRSLCTSPRYLPEINIDPPLWSGFFLRMHSFAKLSNWHLRSKNISLHAYPTFCYMKSTALNLGQ